MKTFVLTLVLLLTCIGEAKVLKTKTQYQSLKRTIESSAASPTQVWEAARLALYYGDSQWAIQHLDGLLSKKTSIDKNQLLLMKARGWYQTGKFNKAIETYSDVSKDSPEWVLALEEKAWAYLKLGQEDKAIAETTTLLSSYLDQKIGPEPYFLASLAHLRICDYVSVFKVGQQFKNRYKEKILEFQAQSKIGSEKMRAERRLGETDKTIKRLQLIEAEAVQRVYAAERAATGKTDIQVADGSLVFPKTDDEVWSDELGQFQVGAKKCPEPSLAPSLAGGKL
jgi:hypothetical protein